MLPVLLVASSAPTLFDAALDSGIIDWPRVALSIVRVGYNMVAQARETDRRSSDEWVNLARSRVPQDTGNLLAGIEVRYGDGYAEWRASGERVGLGGRQPADYARFVEFGTKPGQRGGTSSGASMEGFYATDAASGSPFSGARVSRARRTYRTHPGNAAQPFFYNSAREVLARRAGAFESAMSNVVSDEGLE